MKRLLLNDSPSALYPAAVTTVSSWQIEQQTCSSAFCSRPSNLKLKMSFSGDSKIFIDCLKLIYGWQSCYAMICSSTFMFEVHKYFLYTMSCTTDECNFSSVLVEERTLYVRSKTLLIHFYFVFFSFFFLFYINFLPWLFYAKLLIVNRDASSSSSTATQPHAKRMQFGKENEKFEFIQVSSVLLLSSQSFLSFRFVNAITADQSAERSRYLSPTQLLTFLISLRINVHWKRSINSNTHTQ